MGDSGTLCIYFQSRLCETFDPQPLHTRGLGPGVGGTLALYDVETAYPANIKPTSSAAKRTKIAAYLHQGLTTRANGPGPQDGNAGILVQHHEQTKLIEI